MRRPLLLLFAAAGAALACGSNSTSGLRFPQVQNAGGPVLSRATLVSVTFGTDALAAQANEFVQKFPASSVWALTAEYGIGAAAVATPIQSSMALKSTMDENDWQSMLPSELDPAKDGFSTPTGEQILILFLPEGVVATNNGLVGCEDFGGYHSAVKLSDGTQVAYAVVPRCRAFNGLDMLNSLTGVASHEILEAATDPFDALSQPAWSDVDPADYAFSLAFGGGEICDMCLNSFPPFYIPPDLGFTVQRVWSNAAARAEQDPCLPTSDAGPFIDAMPQLGTQNFNVNGSTQAVKSLSIPVGGSADVPLDLLSVPASTTPWALSVINLSADGGSVDWSIVDAGTNAQGATLHLTIDGAGSQSGISGNSELIAVESAAGARIEFWPILIINQ